MPFSLLSLPPAVLVSALLLSLCAGCNRHSNGHPVPNSEEQAADGAPAEAVTRFTLSPRKQLAAGVRLGTVTELELQALATVPGRVQYDDSRHIEVKVPAEGILLDVFVQPGTSVAEGDTLARVSCPEVGTARADELRRRVEFELAQQRYEWKNSACVGLKQLVAAVQEGRDPQQLEKDMSTLKLGNYREQVLSAYSRFRLAESLATAANTALDSGALSGRTIQERISERDSARAALTSVTEQGLFQACQEATMARLELADSERRLKISRQVVRNLLGDGESTPVEQIDEDQLSLVEIHAPISGTIESRIFSKRERVKPQDTLFVLANTSRLWVAADIRELEWRALNLQPGEKLSITSPAMPNQELTSKVEFVGREVDPRNNAVPLVASITNPDGSLRPGQFVWVRLPLGKAHRGLAVPEPAIVEHDGKSFVFVPEADNQFQRVDIQTGLRQDGLVEVVSGLQANQPVVVSGAFALKSEMLLEREAE